MTKLKILRGLPASGKTTYAKKVCKENTLFVRINYDDLRAMLSQRYSAALEYEIVQPVAFNIAKKAMQLGYNVIIDNCNLNSNKVEEWTQLGKELDAEIEVIDFLDVPIEECVKRDKNRPNSVGEDVIMYLYNKLKQ